ncbi:DUF4355 domain-containing protein [Actinomadura rubrisoli]|uniref:DUF4355 domain-containing protein n=1 Tax=Actinomadura rubrisoli TaxID=2530368 RepID=A0A4V2YZL1_9ACTN|nr:DUF4355 domain-containing protein [Actinomadura rubrisoli]TDD97637.1 hypothetical protein E1298_00980 [Actinomadura rubrisoli]
MSENAPEPVAPAEPAQPAEPATEPAPAQPGEVEQPSTDPGKGEEKDWEAEAAKWKSMARKHETEAKKNATAAQKYAEWEDTQKSEQQRLADRVAAAEAERDDARRSHAQLMAAATHNVPPSLIDRIGGSTADEINESAEALAAEITRLVQERASGIAPAPAPAPEPKSAPAATRPVESLTPGARPANEAPADPNEAFRSFLTSRRT